MQRISVLIGFMLDDEKKGMKGRSERRDERAEEEEGEIGDRESPANGETSEGRAEREREREREKRGRERDEGGNRSHRLALESVFTAIAAKQPDLAPVHLLALSLSCLSLLTFDSQELATLRASYFP